MLFGGRLHAPAGTRPQPRDPDAARLAQDGTDIIAIDLCGPVRSVAYPMPTLADLEQTAKDVEALGRRIVTRQADVRDFAGLEKAFQEGVTELGPVQIVVARADSTSNVWTNAGS